MKSLEERLAEALNYYVVKPSRRCRTEKACAYSGVTLGIKTKGCIVGYFLSAKQRLEWDKAGVSCLSYLNTKGVNKTPKIILDNLNTFERFQALHDGTNYWDEKGLTDKGIGILKIIIREMKLNPEPFKKFLS